MIMTTIKKKICFLDIEEKELISKLNNIGT